MMLVAMMGMGGTVLFNHLSGHGTTRGCVGIDRRVGRGADNIINKSATAMSSSSSRGEPLLSASEEPYHLAGVQQGKKSFGWPQVCTSLCLGIAIGAGIGYHAFRTAQQETAPAVVVHEEQIVKSKLSNLPDPCAGWESRCHAGAAAAKKQGMGVFWPAAQCDDVLPPHGQTAGKTSCANRASTWSSGSIAQRPSPAGELSASVVADPLKHDTLFVFLPGTGTSPVAVRSLLDAAADMGCHVLALSYASLPVAVSQMNLWCTRDGADPALCNIELHEAVLFGASTTKKGASGLWEVSANQSVAYLLEAALRELQWGQFLNGSAGVRWDRIVVAGHSQGASHAAYLSTRKPLRGAVLFSGPQEVPECSSGWIGDAAAMPMLRRAVYSLKEVRARAATSSTAPPPPHPPPSPNSVCCNLFGSAPTLTFGVCSSNLHSRLAHRSAAMRPRSTPATAAASRGC